MLIKIEAIVREEKFEDVKAALDAMNAGKVAIFGGGTGNPIVWWIIGGIIVAAIAGGCVWYFCFFRRGKNPFQKK